jgi:hypothetical protein
MPPEDVAPIPSGVGVGSGSGASTPTAPRTINIPALNAHSLSTAQVLREAEDAALSLRQQEDARASLYTDTTDGLAEKYGVDHG